MLNSMSNPRPHLNRVRVLAGLALALLVAACDSGPTWVLDSDVPQMPDMEQRLGFDIKRRSGDLVGGTFIFIGNLSDMQESVSALCSRFRDAGWSVESSTVSFPRSTVVFAQDDRRVNAVVDADLLEPAMSRAQYVVSITDAKDAMSVGADGG